MQEEKSLLLKYADFDCQNGVNNDVCTFKFLTDAVSLRINCFVDVELYRNGKEISHERGRKMATVKGPYLG